MKKLILETLLILSVISCTKKVSQRCNCGVIVDDPN
jgi:hypothetical protein